jgi:predicted GIY-YIG superfamily endonuclease
MLDRYGNYVNHFGYTGRNPSVAAMAEQMAGSRESSPHLFAATRSSGHAGKNHFAVRTASEGARTAALTACGKVLSRPMLHSDPEIHLELCDDCALADYRRACVYRLYDADGQLLYIGCTVALERRLTSHMSSSEFGELISRCEWVEYDSEAEAFAAECRAIETESPRYNRQLVGAR